MNYDIALNKAATFCASSEKCEQEVRNKLQKWGIGSSDTDKIIEHLITEGFIDEERYCNAFVKDKFRFNRWGKTKIAFMLRQKGISADVVNQAIDDCIDYDEYLSVLTELLAAKKRSIKTDDRRQLQAKLYNFAASRGFESSVAHEALKELSKNI